MPQDFTILTEDELVKLDKKGLVAAADALSEELGVDIDTSQSMPKIIDQYLAVVSSIEVDEGSEGEVVDDAVVQAAGVSDVPIGEPVVDAVEVADDEALVLATATFETLVEGRKVKVLRGDTILLPDDVAESAVSDGVAEFV
ncbi:hypothetical protein ABMA58_00160 [Oceanospirillum sp. HFRX-1_2]